RVSTLAVGSSPSGSRSWRTTSPSKLSPAPNPHHQPRAQQRLNAKAPDPASATNRAGTSGGIDATKAAPRRRRKPKAIPKRPPSERVGALHCQADCHLAVGDCRIDRRHLGLSRPAGIVITASGLPHYRCYHHVAGRKPGNDGCPHHGPLERQLGQIPALAL